MISRTVISVIVFLIMFILLVLLGMWLEHYFCFVIGYIAGLKLYDWCKIIINKFTS